MNDNLDNITIMFPNSRETRKYKLNEPRLLKIRNS